MNRTLTNCDGNTNFQTDERGLRLSSCSNGIREGHTRCRDRIPCQRLRSELATSRGSSVDSRRFSAGQGGAESRLNGRPGGSASDRDTESSRLGPATVTFSGTATAILGATLIWRGPGGGLGG